MAINDGIASEMADELWPGIPAPKGTGLPGSPPADPVTAYGTLGIELPDSTGAGEGNNYASDASHKSAAGS